MNVIYVIRSFFDFMENFDFGREILKATLELIFNMVLNGVKRKE